MTEQDRPNPIAETDGVGALKAAGFSEEGIERLKEARQRRIDGKISDQTQVDNNLLFFRWMREEGRIGG